MIDKVVITKGINLRSLKETQAHLLENLRVDEYWLSNLDVKLIKHIQKVAPKKESITFLIKLITGL